MRSKMIYWLRFFQLAQIALTNLQKERFRSLCCFAMPILPTMQLNILMSM